MLSTRMRFVACALSIAILIGTFAARAQRPGAISLEGRVVAVQEGVPLCGILATAGWATLEVSRPRADVPRLIRIMVQCQALSVGHRYRLSLAASRPTDFGWPMFAVIGDPPGDGVPLYWALDDVRELRD